MKTLTFKYIDKKSSAKILGLSFLQQVIAAFGTYALIQAGFHIESGINLAYWIAAALFCHAFAPFLSMLIKPLESILSLQAFRNYVADKLLSKTGKPSLWQQKHQRENFLASLGGETESYLAAIIFVGLDLFSYTASIILNVLVLGISLDKTFIPTFIASGILSYICYEKFKTKIENAFYQDQQKRTSTFSYLLTCWDNVLLKNEQVNRNYKTQLNDRFDETQKTSANSSLWYEGMVSGLSLVSFIPVAAAIIYIAVKNQSNTVLLVALLATIPRQLAMLTTFKSIFQAATSFISFEAKFKSFSGNTEIDDTDLKTRIQHQGITLNSKNYNSLEEFKSVIEKSTPRRIEIRGNNGAGKSTLLLHLNDTLNSSIYLPANPSFDLPNRGSDSTGNNLLRHIEHLSNSDVSHILLDEWDANLDQENIQKINNLLDGMAQSKVIVEVRHR